MNAILLTAIMWVVILIFAFCAALAKAKSDSLEN
jgi:hypothetical protein